MRKFFFDPAGVPCFRCCAA